MDDQQELVLQRNKEPLGAGRRLTRLCKVSDGSALGEGERALQTGQPGVKECDRGRDGTR